MNTKSLLTTSRNRSTYYACAFLALVGIWSCDAPKHDVTSNENPKDVVVTILDEDLTSIAKQYGIQLDTSLSSNAQFFDLGYKMRYGNLAPHQLDVDWFIDKENVDSAQIISLVNNKDWDGLSPKVAEFRQLRSMLSSFENVVDTNWTSIYTNKTIEHYHIDTLISLIHFKLLQTGDLKTPVCDPNFYSDSLINAVKAFQIRMGLNADGRIGKGTIKALNISPSERLAQIKANMERWRWLPDTFPDYYVLVNVADYDAKVIKNGEIIAQHEVMVGKPKRKTPMLRGKMTGVVFNPKWSVPPTILKEDVIPSARKNVDYIYKKGFSIYDRSGFELTPEYIDWDDPIVKNYRFVQPPSRSNALGTIKFLFNNKYHIFLHDTPSKRAFKNDYRALSSGCVRVENPNEFAATIIGDTAKYSTDDIDAIVSKKRTKSLRLEEQPEVIILYFTAWKSDDGLLHFRDDVYGWDKKVATALDNLAIKEG